MSYTPLIFTILFLHTVFALWATAHALLNKRDPRAALGWIMVCIFFVVFGPLIYWMIGVNRVQRRARRLIDKSTRRTSGQPGAVASSLSASAAMEFGASNEAFLTVSSRLCQLPLTEGNRVEILMNGDEAYPEMLQTLEKATQSVYLLTYIFDNDEIGNEFIEALVRCQQRGLEVKVLIDGVGELGLHKRASTLLRKKGITVERFLPFSMKPPAFYWNLRNHRKLLVIDQIVAFTGGLNISSRHVLEHNKSESRVEDIHFKLTGSVVSEMERVFKEDWEFVTAQRLKFSNVKQVRSGNTLCRVIIDEPSERTDRLATTLVGVVSAAKQRVVIMTPYFLPPRELISALLAAALRGISVTILLPSKNDNFLVHWATRNLLWQLLQFDVKIYYQPAPFVHSKLFIVDDALVFFGSANIDPRSLRLNFELNIETYSVELVEKLMEYVRQKIAISRAYTLQDVESRPLMVRYRDALAWLFSPYL